MLIPILIPCRILHIRSLFTRYAVFIIHVGICVHLVFRVFCIYTRYFIMINSIYYNVYSVYYNYFFLLSALGISACLLFEEKKLFFCLTTIIVFGVRCKLFDFTLFLFFLLL